MDELQQNLNIAVKAGTIEFKDIEVLQAQAEEVARIIMTTEVDEANVKEVKQKLATVNKAVKAIEDKRIEVKKVYMIPYNRLEEKIKSITGTIKTAESQLRTKVTEMENSHKYDKLQEISRLWEIMTVEMNAPEFLKLNKFLKEQHLNKSVSFKQIDAEMAMFIRKVKEDVGVIKTLESSQSVMGEYIETLNLAEAIKAVHAQAEKLSKAEQIFNPKPEQIINPSIKKTSSVSAFYIRNEFIADMVEDWLEEQGIEYKRVEVQE